MNWKVVWTDNAIAGVREVAVFQEEVSAGGGTRLLDSIFDQMGKMVSFPRSAPRHPLVDDQRIRRLVFGKYILIYRIMDDQQVLQVLAVRHHRQKGVEPGELI